MKETIAHGLPNPQTEPDRPIRVLLMIASMDGGGSEQQTLLLLKHLDRRRVAPELYLLRRAGSLLAQVPDDVPVHGFEDAPRRQSQRGRQSQPHPPSQQERPWQRVVIAAVGRWRFLAWAVAIVRSLNWPGKIHRAQVRDLIRVLREREIDVIYDRTFLMTLIAAPAAAQVGVPRVSTIVSPPSRVVPLNAGRFLTAKRRRLRAAYASAAAVVCVSRPTAQDAAKYYGLPRRRFTLIPNPVDAESLDAVVANSPAPPRDRRWTIACVGRISVEKGQSALLEALDQLRNGYPDFPLPCVWMIGDGVMRQQLERRAESLGLGDQVRFLGHIAQPAPWIAAADAVCLPSHFEGFPNVMLEAMALGVPVIARSIDVTRSLGSNAPPGESRGRDHLALFDQSSGSRGVDLARKIRRVRLNTAGTQSRVRAARRLARQGHAIARLVPMIEQLLLKAQRDSWQMRQGG